MLENPVLCSAILGRNLEMNMKKLLVLNSALKFANKKMPHSKYKFGTLLDRNNLDPSQDLIIRGIA